MYIFFVEGTSKCLYLFFILFFYDKISIKKICKKNRAVKEAEIKPRVLSYFFYLFPLKCSSSFLLFNTDFLFLGNNKKMGGK